MASDLASDLTDRIEQAGDKLRKLELVSRPARKTSKKRGKLGKLTMLAMVGGIAYAIYRMVRGESMDTPTTSMSRDMHESDTGVTTPKPAVRSA